MKKRLSIIMLFSVIFSASTAFGTAMGGYDAGSINSQYMKDIRTFDLRKENQKRIQQIEKPQQMVTVGNLSSVSFINNRAYSEKTLQGIVQEYIGQPLNPTTLMQMRKKIMKFYQSNGYYSAVAVVESENMREGTVTFRIQEGTKDSIQIEGGFYD